MYDATADPYCYPGTTVLKNVPGLRSQTGLDQFEAVATANRFTEPMPTGRWSVRHYRATHHHIFQDVYRWAGLFRTVPISRGSSISCYPEQIPAELRRIFAELKAVGFLRDVPRDLFVSDAAHFAAELNAIHAFRDGNGRAQLTFMTLLAASAGHPFDLERLDPDAFLTAMIRSFHGDEASLANQFRKLVTSSRTRIPRDVD